MMFKKGNELGNRFTSDNQPPNRGRKPSIFKYIKEKTGKKVDPEMSKEDYVKVIRHLMESTPEEIERLVKDADGSPNKDTPIWVLNVISAINSDIRYGRTSTVEMLFDRVFGKVNQSIDVTSDGKPIGQPRQLTTEEAKELIRQLNDEY